MSLFSRKGYILIGKAVRNADGLSAHGRAAVVRELCKVFKDDNHAFREDVFRDLANAKIDDDPMPIRNPLGKNGRN
jgi:hypothetical protein